MAGIEQASRARAATSSDATRRSGAPTLPLSRACELPRSIRGIDLMYRGEQGRLEYDLEVAPNADPVAYQAGNRGRAQTRASTRRAICVIGTGGRRCDPARTADLPDHRRSPAHRAWRLCPRRMRIRWHSSWVRMTTRYPLIIDPLLTYASYLGGTGGDSGVSIAVDQSDGSAWVTGTTTSTDFPVTADALPADQLRQTRTSS